MAKVPRATPVIVRHDATPVPTKTTAPRRQARVEVSPIDPGMSPTKARVQSAVVRASAERAAPASNVAPESASTSAS